MDLEKYFKMIPITEMYKDLFKPGMKKAGEALATVMDGANLVLLPLRLLNAKSKIYFDNNLQRYSDKINNEQNLTLTQVPQYVGLPIVEKLTYLDQNELSETFINLLTKASFEETLNLVHPAFISILNNLSADEAKILFHLKNTERIPFVDFYIRRYVETIQKPDENEPKNKDSIQKLIDYTFQDKQEAFIKYAWNLTNIENQVELMFPENIDLYIENLQFSGLIIFEHEKHMINDAETYENLEKKNYKEIYSNLENFIEEDNSEFKLEIQVRKGYIEFSELGKKFITACIKDLN